MSLIRVSFNAFDSDGCLFSIKKYFRLLAQIVDKYYDFLCEYKDKNNKLDDDYVGQTVHAILKDIETATFDKLSIHNKAMIKRISTVQKRLEKLVPGFTSAHAVHKIVAEHIRSLNQLSPLILKQILLAANSQLMTDLCADIINAKMMHAIFALGTNRQSFIHDLSGVDENGTDSAYVSLLYLTEYGNQLLMQKGISCISSEFSMGDIYGHAKFDAKSDKVEYQYFERGHSFKKTVDEFTKRVDNKPVHLDHAHYIYDKNKLTLIYALAHDVMVHVLKSLKIKQDQAELTFNFFDNEKPILEALAKILKMYPELLPKGMVLNLYHYDGELTKQPIATIVGTGIVDECFQQNVRLMATMCGHDLKNLNEPIDAATQLNVPDFLQRRRVAVSSLSDSQTQSTYTSKVDLLFQSSVSSDEFVEVVLVDDDKPASKVDANQNQSSLEM